MPKRKKNDKELDSDERERKIARYERRLARYREEQLSDEMAQTPELDPELEVSMDQSQDLDNEKLTVGQLQDLDNQELTVGQTDQSKEQGSPPKQASSELNNETGVAQGSTSNEELDADFLSALGESASGMKQYGEEIHKEIFNTINKILLEGLQKQNKEKIIETILIPSNCKLLDAPKLNIELLGVLNNPSKSRDKLMEDRQQEMGIAIGGICQIINSLSKRDYSKFDTIKKLTDVSRILCNLHYQYTEIRRRLVNPFLDKNLVESLKNNKREEFLYSNLDNSVKSYSAMKRAANVIKPRSVVSVPTKFSSKNLQQPPRRPNPNQVQSGRGSFRGATHQRYNPRQQFKPPDNRPLGPSMRGRAKYP